METMTPLEQFHQLVLFQLMDTIMPDEHRWIAVDDDGCVFAYTIKPQHHDDQSYWASQTMTLDRSLGLRMTIPRDVSWEDCVWRL